jgi:hypothetical protein
MRAAAEVSTTRVRGTGRHTLTVLLLAALLVGCAAPTGPAGGPAPASSVAVTASSGQTPAVAVLVQRAFDAFNATAGGSVAAQQSEIGKLVSTGQAQVQARCPKATSTISFEPVYARLAPAPNWRPGSGTLPGRIFAIPTLIRIYTGNRITGTDLTDLHLSVDGGQISFPALCLR